MEQLKATARSRLVKENLNFVASLSGHNPDKFDSTLLFHREKEWVQAVEKKYDALVDAAGVLMTGEFSHPNGQAAVIAVVEEFTAKFVSFKASVATKAMTALEAQTAHSSPAPADGGDQSPPALTPASPELQLPKEDPMATDKGHVEEKDKETLVCGQAKIMPGHVLTSCAGLSWTSEAVTAPDGAGHRRHVQTDQDDITRALVYWYTRDSDKTGEFDEDSIGLEVDRFSPIAVSIATLVHQDVAKCSGPGPPNLNTCQELCHKFDKDDTMEVSMPYSKEDMGDYNIIINADYEDDFFATLCSLETQFDLTQPELSQCCSLSTLLAGTLYPCYCLQPFVDTI